MSKSYKWLLIALLSCAFFFHQADRALFGLMTICMGFIGGFAGALFFRSIATGVGESFYAPSAYALIACHHKETRSSRWNAPAKSTRSATTPRPVHSPSLRRSPASTAPSRSCRETRCLI